MIAFIQIIGWHFDDYGCGCCSSFECFVGKRKVENFQDDFQIRFAR